MEHAGAAFEKKALALLGIAVQADSESNPVLEDEAEEEKFKGKFKQKHTLAKSDDFYEILGLGDLRWRATAEQIKAACNAFNSF